MISKILAFVAMTTMSGCVLTTNEVIDDLRIGMSLAEAETILGEPTTVRDLRTVDGTTPTKNIVRECRTYRYVHDNEQSSRADRFTWVTYNAGRVAGYSDNGYASSNGSYCHG